MIWGAPSRSETGTTWEAGTASPTIVVWSTGPSAAVASPAARSKAVDMTRSSSSPTPTPKVWAKLWVTATSSTRPGSGNRPSSTLGRSMATPNSRSSGAFAQASMNVPAPFGTCIGTRPMPARRPVRSTPGTVPTSS